MTQHWKKLVALAAIAWAAAPAHAESLTLASPDGKITVTVSDGIEPIGIAGGAYDGKPNPHAWMSPENALIYVENIRKALTDIDPANAAIYEANARTYSQQISAEIEPMKAEIAKIPENERFLVTSEGAFSYLARDLGMKELYLWPINADSQGTPQQVKAVVDQVIENEIPVVFSESTVSDKPASQVAAKGASDAPRIPARLKVIDAPV